MDRARQGSTRTRTRLEDPREAEAAIAEVYLPSRIERRGVGPLDLRLDTLELPSVTAGMVSFRAKTRLRTAEATHFHVDVPVTGQVVNRSGESSAGTSVVPGQATVFMPDRPADILWSELASQLCLMIPRRTLEDELAHMIGQDVTQPLTFAPEMDLSAPLARSWRSSLDVLVAELSQPAGLTAHPRVAQQLERFVVDGLLMAQPHNYSQALTRRERRPSAGPLTAAQELLEDRPEEAWSTPALAAAVHLSVRSLQEGFARNVGVPPMRYLQQVRLRRAHALLLEAAPDQTTVAAVAAGLGITHRGRFAAAYRQEFSESPAVTLRRR